MNAAQAVRVGTGLDTQGRDAFNRGTAGTGSTYSGY